MRLLGSRIEGAGGEDGFTLIELLVAAAMSVVLVAAASSMLISAVRDQPKISKRSQDVSTARWILERMTREIRNGVAVDTAGYSMVSFQGYVRHTTCGGTQVLPPQDSAKLCQITYDCSSGTHCTRTEGETGTSGGPTETIFSGIRGKEVFSYEPDSGAPTFVGVTLRFPNPDGTGTLTISDGANLRGVDPFG